MQDRLRLLYRTRAISNLCLHHPYFPYAAIVHPTIATASSLLITLVIDFKIAVMASTSPPVSSRTPNGATPSNKRTAGQPSLEFRADGRKRFRGCSRISDYILMSKLGEGTFGEVHKAESRRMGQLVAMKKILMHQEKDGFPVTALREIKLLKMLSHPNVLKLEEMAVEKNREAVGRKKAIVYMVTPYMDHDLSGLLENPAVKFTEAQIKCYMMQLLEGVAYLHAKNILHRDLKAANLLINNEGILQIADFGLARPYDDPPPQPGKGNGEATRGYTTVVVTRWYRPPELLLQLRYYTPAIDMWGVGCVFGEMFKGHPILAGTSDANQIHLIFELMGSPTEDNMPGWSQLPGCEGIQNFGNRYSKLSQEFRDQGSCFISLMAELLKLNWRKRINDMDSLQHPYFKNAPLPSKPGEIPTFQESHELDRRKFREQKANLPPAPAGGTVGMGPDGDFANGNGHGHPPRGGQGGYHGSQQQQQQQPYRPPRNGHENRYPYPPHPGNNSRAPPPPPSHPPQERVPAWQRQPNGLPPRPPTPKNGLNYATGGAGVRPPPPPLHDTGRGGVRPVYDGARDRPLRDLGPPRPPRDRGVSGGPEVDTYIPSYKRDENPRHREGYSRVSEGRGSRDEATWIRDGATRRDDRDRDRDRDRDSGIDRRERDDRDRGGDRRRRSRSPEWDRREREGSHRERDRRDDHYRR